MKQISWEIWLVNVGTGLLALLWAVPIVWALIVALRPPDDSLGKGDVWFGESITVDSVEKTNDLAPFFPAVKEGKISDSYLINTVEYVSLTISVQLITTILAGFAFAHYQFPGKRLLFYAVLMQMMIPMPVLLVPNFTTIREFPTTLLLIPKFIYYHVFNFYDTPLAMALPYFGSAFGTFLMRQAFLEIPSDLVDAGKIDGCRWYQLLWYIYIPPTRPSIVAFALVSISFHWNSLLWPLVVTSDKSRPLTMGLLRFTQLSEIGAQWSLIMSATMIIVAPLLILFLIFQRQFIKSFIHSGLK